MFSHPTTLSFSAAAMLRLTAGAVLESPNNPMPSEYVSVMPIAWENTEAVLGTLNPSIGFLKYHNWALDQIIDGNGTVNVCMRWNSDKTLDEDTRNALEAQHVKQYEQWLEWLPGWDNFPFDKINFETVAWAVANDSQLVGSRDGFHVYTEFKDDKGFPTCDPGCSRHLHPDGDYSGCGRGDENRFHQHFMISNAWGDFSMGAASGEGFDLSEFGWETVGAQMGNWSILVHETGHTFGLRDYVNDLKNKTHSTCSVLWLPPNYTDQMVMEPTDYGAHIPLITRFEGWLTRYLWSRFSRERGWQEDDGMVFPPVRHCTEEEVLNA